MTDKAIANTCVTGNLFEHTHPQLCRRQFLLRPGYDNALAAANPIEHSMLDIVKPKP
jgi:hypothetical protein